MSKLAMNGEWVTLGDNGRYTDALGNYGYRAHFGGGWVCYTDGVLCDCGGEE